MVASPCCDTGLRTGPRRRRQMAHSNAAFSGLLLLRAQSFYDRQNGRNEKLLGCGIQWVMDESRNGVPCLPDFLAERIDGELEVTRVCLNGRNGHLAKVEGQFDLAAGRPTGGDRRSRCEVESSSCRDFNSRDSTASAVTTFSHSRLCQPGHYI